eukprot:CAMPEP_0180127226 /NCGR_PEP_ID=MMETSP0986-20121125/6119_1 /TAXON_ID=697907 /ORGANISM="non described non described, Strain CCMP2293" /LENGTH=194 /DNA_ID=CAMNT_0022066713 /DNA_START=75 /DNA_END=660 /DNA_ORIENTATION=-
MWGVLRIWSEWGSGARDPAGDGCAAGTDVWRPAAPPPGPGHGATWGGVGVQDDKGWEDGGQQLRESSSAYECGLVRDGDILNSVEGQSVENLPVAAIHMMLLGAQDSWVQMKFMRQTDAKANRGGRHSQRESQEPMLGNGVSDTVWASSKMRSFAPTYDTICVDLCRKTPSNILVEAASQAKEEAMSAKNKRRA